MTYSQARELAIETELRRIGEHHSQVEKYKEYNIQEWTIILLTLNIFITRSRLVDYCIGALSVAASISVVFGTAASNDTTEIASFLKSLILALLIIYVPYSFFFALQYLVIFGKILHLRDSDFWFDFKSVWIWIKESCCKSNTMDLIKLARIVLATDEDSTKLEDTSTKNSAGNEDEPTFEPARYELSELNSTKVDIMNIDNSSDDNDNDENSLNGEVDSNYDDADVEEPASLNSVNDNQELDMDNRPTEVPDISFEGQSIDDSDDMAFEISCNDATNNNENNNDNSANDVVQIDDNDESNNVIDTVIDKNSSSRRYGSINIDDIENMTDDDDEYDSNYVIKEEVLHNESNQYKTPTADFSSIKIYGTVDCNYIENFEIEKMYEDDDDEVNESSNSDINVDNHHLWGVDGVIGAKDTLFNVIVNAGTNLMNEIESVIVTTDNMIVNTTKTVIDNIDVIHVHQNDIDKES